MRRPTVPDNRELLLIFCKFSGDMSLIIIWRSHMYTVRISSRKSFKKIATTIWVFNPPEASGNGCLWVCVCFQPKLKWQKVKNNCFPHGVWKFSQIKLCFMLSQMWWWRRFQWELKWQERKVAEESGQGGAVIRKHSRNCKCGAEGKELLHKVETKALKKRFTELIIAFSNNEEWNTLLKLLLKVHSAVLRGVTSIGNRCKHKTKRSKPAPPSMFY